MASIKSIINLYNNEAINCSGVNKPDNSFSNQCQITNVKLQTQHIKQNLDQILETIMEKQTTKPVKLQLNSDMETIRNQSTFKKIGYVQNI